MAISSRWFAEVGAHCTKQKTGPIWRRRYKWLPAKPLPLRKWQHGDRGSRNIAWTLLFLAVHFPSPALSHLFRTKRRKIYETSVCDVGTMPTPFPSSCYSDPAQTMIVGAGFVLVSCFFLSLEFLVCLRAVSWSAHDDRGQER